MSAGTVIASMIELLERWGWAQRTTVDAEGFDIIGAYEEVTGIPAMGTAPDDDRVIAAFADPSLDQALRTLAHLIGPDPADGPLPDERWAWVHVITGFNDREDQTWAVVRRTLHEARELADRTVD